jgi:hypothetical protein
MGFPAPKPRNIEKDVKVFPWKILSHALKKIIGKYVSTSFRILRLWSLRLTQGGPSLQVTHPPLGRCQRQSVPPLLATEQHRTREQNRTLQLLPSQFPTLLRPAATVIALQHQPTPPRLVPRVPP